MILRSPLLVTVLALAPLSGCDLERNQCGLGQTTCHGAEMFWCTECDTDTIGGGQYRCWVPSRPLPCPNYCVEAEGQANCSMTSAPVPECARDGNACWQGSPVECLGGFPLDYGAFAPCEVDAGETCVNASCVPLADSGAD
jgi:hypothetical protein